MKCLVISDTHGRLSYAQMAIERLKANISTVFHLGDMVRDAQALEAKYKGIAFYYVAGNCDYYYSAAKGMLEHKLVELCGVNIFMAHGHEDGVKSGYGQIALRGKTQGAGIVLCGHTHMPFNDIVSNVLCVNPGSISMPRGMSQHPTYAVLNIPEDGAAPWAGIASMEASFRIR